MTRGAAHELDQNGIAFELRAERFSNELELCARQASLEVLRRLADASVEVLVDVELAPFEAFVVAARDARLFRRADAELYRAKSGGRNRIVIDGREVTAIAA